MSVDLKEDLRDLSGGLRELLRALNLAHDPRREVVEAAEVLNRRLSTLDL